MIVSVAAYKRPEYLEEALTALAIAAQEIDEVVWLYARIDPSPVEGEMFDMLNAWETARIFVNEEVKGCAGNTLLAVEGAFDLARRMDEDYVQHLEEDFVFAPDALRLSAWIRETYRADKQVLAGGVQTAHAATPDEYLSVHKSSHFHCQGWSTWVDRWEMTLKPRWQGTKDTHTIKLGDVSMGGWADNFNDRIFPSTGGVQVIPRLSRCKHIGRYGGLHTTEETFKKDYPTVYAADVDIPDGSYYALSGAEAQTY